MRYVFAIDVTSDDVHDTDPVQLLDQVEDQINAITFPGLGRVLVVQMAAVKENTKPVFNDENVFPVWT